MSIHPYQIIVVMLAVFIIQQGAVKYLRHENQQTLLKFFVRVVIWGGMATIAAFPTISNSVASLIGIEGNINAVILIGFILVFLMIFKLLSAIETLEQQITSIVRKDAMRSFENLSGGLPNSSLE